MLLAETAGVSAVGVVTQVRRKPHQGTYVGKGKLEELRAEVLRHGADLVIFNNELSPTQQRNLVNVLECKILDRTEIILDIFGSHAHTREGKLQVELARLSYELPRLTGRGKMMSRIGGGSGGSAGGAGTRGPGEPQLATDRRHVERHLRLLRAELAEIATRRNTERAARRKAGVPVIALVGYTNAGKSTLLNALAGSEEASSRLSTRPFAASAWPTTSRSSSATPSASSRTCPTAWSLPSARPWRKSRRPTS
jgi:GTP-binding protein HflX